jgi:hypothetical protein
MLLMRGVFGAPTTRLAVLGAALLLGTPLLCSAGCTRRASNIEAYGNMKAYG